MRNFNSEQSFHIFNRGVDKREIVIDEEDRKRFRYYLRVFLDDPKRVERSYVGVPGQLLKGDLRERIEVFSYILMPNHYHLHIRPEDKEAVPELMKRLSNAYTGYFNLKYDRMGSLFEGRYKAVAVEGDEANLQVHRYIQINAVVAGLVRQVGEYKWSSEGEYLQGMTGICDTDRVLGQFGSRKEYREFLQDEVDYKRNMRGIKDLVIE